MSPDSHPTKSLVFSLIVSFLCSSDPASSPSALLFFAFSIWLRRLARYQSTDLTISKAKRIAWTSPSLVSQFFFSPSLQQGKPIIRSAHPNFYCSSATGEVLRHIGALLILFSCVKPLLILSKHPSFKKFDKFFPMFMKVRGDILNLLNHL